jgi:S-adenosylmethionine decarboxylase
MKPLGIHYLAEFFDCNRAKIDDAAYIERIMLEATELSGARMIKPFFHQFSPQGVSGVIVIAESHFAIHTWPEHGYAAVDLFSCADFDYKSALNHIRERIEARHHFVAQVKRGVSADTEGVHPSEWKEISIES